MEILTFEEALNSIQKEEEKFNESKWIYIPKYFQDYRYLLGTKGTHTLLCIGINPSTAVPDNLDNTLKSVERIALYNKFDSFMMFNVYAQRATNPDNIENNITKKLHKENLRAFEYCLKNLNIKDIWLANGTIIEKRKYLSNCLLEILNISNKYNCKWYRCGKISKYGHPHHPLYLKKNSDLVEFDINKYVDILKN